MSDLNVAIDPLDHRVLDAETSRCRLEFRVVCRSQWMSILNEGAQVPGDHVICVAHRVDGRHGNLDSIGVITEISKGRPQVRERRGAHIGAERVAEVDNEHTSVGAHERHGLATVGCVGERDVGNRRSEDTRRWNRPRSNTVQLPERRRCSRGGTPNR